VNNSNALLAFNADKFIHVSRLSNALPGAKHFFNSIKKVR